MYIIGIILLFILPFAAGCVCRGILRWKETNQIETYLIGFFLLFFLQGVIFVPCVFMGLSFSLACNLLISADMVLLLLGLFMTFLKKRKAPNTDSTEEKKKLPWRKGDRFVFIMMTAVFVLLIVRMALGLDIFRDDIILETVNTTLQTDTMFAHHPLTGMLMDGGMISSKKIITLPLFYAGLCRIINVEADILLYLVINILVLTGSYYASALLFSKVTVLTRGKLYAFWTVYGLLLLAGDYHKGTLTYRLLYQGYEGTSICMGVILPYLLYVLVSWYKQESEEEKISIAQRITYLCKLALGFAASIVITGLGTGFLFLFMAVVIAGVCCLLKSIKEVRACRE